MAFTRFLGYSLALHGLVIFTASLLVRDTPALQRRQQEIITLTSPLRAKQPPLVAGASGQGKREGVDITQVPARVPGKVPQEQTRSEPPLDQPLPPPSSQKRVAKSDSGTMLLPEPRVTPKEILFPPDPSVQTGTPPPLEIVGEGQVPLSGQGQQPGSRRQGTGGSSEQRVATSKEPDREKPSGVELDKREATMEVPRKEAGPARPQLGAKSKEGAAAEPAGRPSSQPMSLPASGLEGHPGSGPARSHSATLGRSQEGENIGEKSPGKSLSVRQEVPVASVTPGPDLSGWLTMIRERIDKAKSYPRLARAQGLEGTITLRFALSPQGQVAKLEVLRSSGHSLLDEAAREAVRKAGPFPYIEGWIVVPLVFELK